MERLGKGAVSGKGRNLGGPVRDGGRDLGMWEWSRKSVS